jgi:hypothetical protein
VAIDQPAFTRLKSYLIYDSGPERIEQLLGFVKEIQNENRLLKEQCEKVKSSFFYKLSSKLSFKK